MYGWTDNKKVLKAFLRQRDKKKYAFIEMDKDEMMEKFSDNFPPEDGMINYIRVKSSQSLEEITLFMTENELVEAEKKIQKMFLDLCSVGNIKAVEEIGYFLNMIVNLKKKYVDALAFIGYRPTEIDILFDSIEDLEARENIFNIYSHYLEPKWEEDISRITIYSIESFIKVMSEDL
jgi:hypothetical protein